VFTETDDRPENSPTEDAGASHRMITEVVRDEGVDRQILQLLADLRVEVSALRSELLGQNQQMLSRMQFLHEGLIGRIKQLREQPTPMRRRPVR
jgi:hypothetical protein